MGLIFGSSVALADASPHVLSRSDVQFQPLNPARGDASPKAGVLWGSIKKDTATGAIIEFVDGFSSPPHIHNITYRGVVISGAVHNDDPEAEHQWMGPGSYWIQPAGEPHITAAMPGSKVTIFLEIDSGPYLVKPIDAAFDNGQRPMNVDASNTVWLGSSDTEWISGNNQIAFLWRNQQSDTGTLIKIPAGESGVFTTEAAALKAVTIAGQISLPHSDAAAIELAPGSYFAPGDSQQIECQDGDTCLIYVTASDRYRFR